MAERLLPVEEAAARLGVKRETLYAYVSRGLLGRVRGTDGRSSLFDPEEVDAFRASRRRSASGELGTVIASSITRLDERGHRYRGVSALQLVRQRRSFEEVADLLWQEPHDAEAWRLPAGLRRGIAQVVDAMPDGTGPRERRRIALSVVASWADSAGSGDQNRSEIGRLAIGSMAFALGTRSAKPLSIAERLWPGLVRGRGALGRSHREARLRCLEAALILLADHGLATSTFAVRVTASVRADPCSIIATGLGAMAGTLHGCAADGAAAWIGEAQATSPSDAIERALAAGERLPGFGHKVYSRRDPREHALLQLVYAAWQEDERIASIRALRAAAARRTGQFANVDFALGALAWLAGFSQAGVSIFGIARTAGWLAHASEEFGEEAVRFRPKARYVAPARD